MPEPRVRARLHACTLRKATGSHAVRRVATSNRTRQPVREPGIHPARPTLSLSPPRGCPEFLSRVCEATPNPGSHRLQQLVRATHVCSVSFRRDFVLQVVRVVSHVLVSHSCLARRTTEAQLVPKSIHCPKFLKFCRSFGGACLAPLQKTVVSTSNSRLDGPSLRTGEGREREAVSRAADLGSRAFFRPWLRGNIPVTTIQ